MRGRNLAILTALVLGLGAFIFFFEKDLPSTDERTKIEKRVFGDLEKGEIEALEITWGEKRVRLERRGAAAEAGEDSGEDGDDGDGETAEPEEWRLVEPLEARADRWAVDSLLGSLIDLEKEQTLEDVEPADVGLDEPRAKVEIATKEGTKVLSLGGKVPASSTLVAGVEGRTEAYRVANSIFDELTREPGEWRDKKLFPGTRGKIERIALEGGPERVLLAKRGERFWLESPLADLADRAAVDALVGKLTALEAKSFVDRPATAEELGLEPPSGAFEVILEGREKPVRIELGAPAEEGASELYARVDGQSVVIAGELAEQLDRPVADWRSHAWSSSEVFQIDTAEIADAEGELKLERDGANWKRGDEEIPYTVASDFLYAVSEIKAEELLSREQANTRGFDLGEPRLEIALVDKEGEREELAVYGTVGGLVAATNSAREGVLLLGEAKVAELEEHLANVRTAEPVAEEGELGENADESADDEADIPAEVE